MNAGCVTAGLVAKLGAEFPRRIKAWSRWIADRCQQVRPAGASRTLALWVAACCAGGCLGCGPRPLRIRDPEVRALGPRCASDGIVACEADCLEDDGAACLAAASAYEMGGTVRPDRAKMKAFERAACDLELALGCRYYSHNKDLAFDDRHAAASAGCLLGDAESCSESYRLAARSIVDEGAPFHRLEQSLEVACSVDPKLCAPLADLERLGIGRDVDDRRAGELYGIACRSGHQAACMSLSEPDRPTVSLPPQLLFTEARVHLSPYTGGGDIGPLPVSERVTMRTRICFAADRSLELETLESSGVASFDHSVRKSSRDWIFVTSRFFPTGRAFCIRRRFDLHRAEPADIAG